MLKSLTTILIAATLVTGCILDPVKPTQINTYEIRPSNQINLNKTPPPKFDETLLIPPMISISPYDSLSMYYSNYKYQIQPYSYSQWVTVPGIMINNAILFYLSSHGPFTSTVNGGVITYANYRLNLILNDLVLNLYKNPPSTNLNVSAQLTNISTGQVIANKNFNLNIPSKVSPKGFVESTNEATNQLGKQIFDWLDQLTLSPETKNK